MGSTFLVLSVTNTLETDLKSPRFVPFGAILTQLRINSIIPVSTTKDVKLGQMLQTKQNRAFKDLVGSLRTILFTFKSDK